MGIESILKLKHLKMLSYFNREREKQEREKLQGNSSFRTQDTSHETRKSLTEADIQCILKKGIGKELTIPNFEIFLISLTHHSWYHTATVDVVDMYSMYSDQNPKLVTGTYERPEFLGDAVLDLIVTDYIYNKFPTKPEGFLTKLRSKLVQSDACIRYAKFLELERYIRISDKAAQKLLSQDDPILLEDIFEAFVAAIFISFNELPGLGYMRCYQFIRGLLDKMYGTTEQLEKFMSEKNNFKEMILMDFQAQLGTWPQPTYYDTHIKDTDLRGFKQCIYIPSDPYTLGWVNPTHLNENADGYSLEIYNYYTKMGFKQCVGTAGNKKAAQQNCSQIALKALEKLRTSAGMSFRPVTIKFQ